MEDERSKSPSKHKPFVSPEGLSKRTHFSSDEIRSLVSMYQRLTSPGKMDRMRFREIMHTMFDMTDDVMLDRIFRVFDGNNDGLVDEQEFILGLSVFLRGTLEEHINFAYFCYDINGDRSLAREELYVCLKNCLIRTSGIEEDVEESVKEIVEIAMKKLDTDKNGQITFPDFQSAVFTDPLLLEACGPVLPCPKAIADFFINLMNYSTGGDGSGKIICSGASSDFSQSLKRRRMRRTSSSFNAID